jgi:L-ascorbate metabolism protein UlaG (beta-lactamase superfamily)
MKITKFVHSCLLVEMSDPINRTVLFDPGVMSTLDVNKLEYLDDVIITHGHSDHFDVDRIKAIVAKFPNVHITAPDEVVEQLNNESIAASSAISEGISFFESPHEIVRPLIDAEPPQEIGVHYLDRLTHPGDSHSFRETKAVLALPVQAPWGTTVEAVRLGLELKPKFVVPIHDWHWRVEARESMYDSMHKIFADSGITFIKTVDGEPFVLDV